MASGTDATQVVEWEDATGKKVKVPPNVRDALIAKFRGQPNLGPKAERILAFFVDKPLLKATQRKLTDTSPHDPLQLTAKENVCTELSLKADPTKKWICGHGRIVCTRLLDHVLSCDAIADSEKEELCRHVNTSKAAKDWLAEYTQRKAIANSNESSKKLSAAEVEAMAPAERNARKRQTALDSRTVQVLSPAQIEALHYALAVFFFVCHIPFAVVEHWAFVALVTALAPAYAPHMFKRNSLSRTWLDRLYEETEEKTNSMFERLPGKATLIIDGFKDVRK
jgi:hypothetical protein